MNQNMMAQPGIERHYDRNKLTINRKGRKMRRKKRLETF
jgi:hypothetical protein